MTEPDIFVGVFVGVDWGARTRRVCIVDSAGRVRGERAFEHGGQELADLADWILDAAPPNRAAVAIEVPHGSAVESPMARQLAAHSIDRKQLDRFRDRISKAGAKDDRRDARVLADALRTDRRYFRRLDAEDPEIVALRARTHIAEDLARERNRLANRLRERLWRYYPQFLELSADLTGEWVLELWTRAPTPDKARRLRRTAGQRILKRHRVRAIDADTAMRRLRNSPIRVAPGTTEAAIAHIENLVPCIALARRQLADAWRNMDDIAQALIDASRNPDAEPGAQGQRDVAIPASPPRASRIVLATPLAEASEPLRRRDDHALRCLCGTAPVTRRSGKAVCVQRRRAAHKRLRNATDRWAMTAGRRDPTGKAKYAALRQRGHRRPRTLGGVADRLLAIACAMLQARTMFNPAYPAYKCRLTKIPLYNGRGVRRQFLLNMFRILASGTPARPGAARNAA